jgi:hypothetical protein
MTLARRIADIKLPTFSTTSSQNADAMVVKMDGNADMTAHEPLKAFLDDLHKMTRTYRIREVTFDVQELYFMNSSCLSLFLRLINAVVESQASHSYSLRFRSNPNLRWQKRSLDAIRTYAKDVVSIE